GEEGPPSRPPPPRSRQRISRLSGESLPRTVGGGLLAGLLLTASIPPFGWWLLGLAGAGLLADTLARLGRARLRLLAGAACGLTLYGVGWWWMGEFSAPGYVLAVVVAIVLLA